MSKADRQNGAPATVASIPLVDAHAVTPDSSIGDLVKEASAQVSTLVRAEVDLARAEITRDVKKGVAGSILFVMALVVLGYSTFFFFFFAAELLDTWLIRWVAFLIVFVSMVLFAVLLAFIGYLRVRKIRGPQQTIETLQETKAALTDRTGSGPGSGSYTGAATAKTPEKTVDPSGW